MLLQSAVTLRLWSILLALGSCDGRDRVEGGASAGASGDDDAGLGPCTVDTFGMAGEEYSRPYEAGVENIKCDFEYTDAAKIAKFVLNYYPSAQHFATYNGTDMIPERNFEYFQGTNSLFTAKAKGSMYKLASGLKKWQPGKNGPVAARERIYLGECEVPQPDGGAYIVQKVGPLVSTGNYDYWQFGWPDIFRLSRALGKHPDGIMFTSSFSGPVDPSGKVLGHPPIHIHHIHITPEPGVMNKMSGLKCMSREDINECYSPNLVIEQHGDYQCSEADGGIDCFFERTADGHAKVLTTPLDLEGEINDVRAPDSEPMTWWYQIVVRWLPKTDKLKALSQTFRVGPGLMNYRDQRNNVLVFPVQTNAESVYWYSGRMERDGRLARNKLHAHNTMFERSFFFRAEPQELGLLAKPAFWPNVSWNPRLLSEVGFQAAPCCPDAAGQAAEQAVRCVGAVEHDE